MHGLKWEEIWSLRLFNYSFLEGLITDTDITFGSVSRSLIDGSFRPCLSVPIDYQNQYALWDCQNQSVCLWRLSSTHLSLITAPTEIVVSVGAFSVLVNWTSFTHSRNHFGELEEKPNIKGGQMTRTRKAAGVSSARNGWDIEIKLREQQRSLNNWSERSWLAAWTYKRQVINL